MGCAFVCAGIVDIVKYAVIHTAVRKEEEGKLMTCVQKPTIGGSAGVSAVAEDNGGTVGHAPDGTVPAPVVDASGVGDETVFDLDPQVLALCHSPGSVDFAAVSALDDAQKAALVVSLTSARDEARARARLAYAELVAARKDDTVVEQCRMDYEAKVRDVGGYVDALALMKTLDILESQGFPTQFNTIDDVIVKAASLLDEGVIDLSDEMSSITDDLVPLFHKPQLKTGFAEIMGMRAHGDDVPCDRLVRLLQRAGEVEDRNPMSMTIFLFLPCDSSGIAQKSDHRRFYDVDFVASLFEGDVPQDDVNEFTNMLISGVRGAALRLYKNAFWDAYREAFRTALKESTGHDHTGVIKVDRWEGDAEQRLRESFERMSAFFPRFLHDKRNKQRDALTVVYNERKYGEGFNSYWTDGMNFIKPVVRRAVVGAVSKRGLMAAPLDDSRFNTFIGDDGVFDDATFITYLDSLGDDPAAGIEREMGKALYENFFPLATAENLETVRDLVARHEQSPGSVGNLTSRNGEYYSIVMDTFTGFDGKERIRVRSAVPVELGDIEMDNACVIGIGLERDGTVVHEMSHDMEVEPQIHQACLAFLDRRTAGAEPVQARAVDDFLVLPGDFYSHYVGRTYEQQGGGQRVHTEVLASGMDAIIPMLCPSYYDKYKDGKLLPNTPLIPEIEERDIVKRIRATLTKDGGVQVIDVPPSTRYDDEHRNLVLGILSAIHANAPTTVEEARTYIQNHSEHSDMEGAQ